MLAVHSQLIAWQIYFFGIGSFSHCHLSTSSSVRHRQAADVFLTVPARGAPHPGLPRSSFTFRPLTLFDVDIHLLARVRWCESECVLAPLEHGAFAVLSVLPHCSASRLAPPCLCVRVDQYLSLALLDCPSYPQDASVCYGELGCLLVPHAACAIACGSSARNFGDFIFSQLLHSRFFLSLETSPSRLCPLLTSHRRLCCQFGSILMFCPVWHSSSTATSNAAAPPPPRGCM